MPKKGLEIRNLGAPIRFTDVGPLAGFAAESAKGGQQVRVWHRLNLTSEDKDFHRMAEGLSGVVRHLAQKAGKLIDLQRANDVLLLLRPDATAELWIDSAARIVECTLKGSIGAGDLVLERDIVDVRAMKFPCVDIGERGKVLFLFREGWRFGMAFDMNPEGNLDRREFETSLGALYRRLKYKHLYDALGEPAVLKKLVHAGWFPFAEIITSEFRDVLNHCLAGFEMAEVDDEIIQKFDAARLEKILERWVAKPHFSVKSDLLRAAMKHFQMKEPVAVIKLILTEIEGVLDGAYRAANGGKGAKTKELIKFAAESAEQKAGRSDTLFFPQEFAAYLSEHTFASFDPMTRSGKANSRHAVGHGAAPQDEYTMPRALQAILTLDQIAFYT